jgi:hypothetical protein
MALRQFVGHYFDRDHGSIGDEPLNLIFNAVSIIVPNLVSNFPKNKVSSHFVLYRGYADLLEMALDFLDKKIDIKTTLRRWIVDSIFTMGIIKTGIATSRDLITFGDNDHIDNGQPYAETVDFDDFIMDPACRHLEEATFTGSRIRVPRQMLLDSGLYRNDFVEKLPSADMDPYDKRDAQTISQHEVTPVEINDLQDYVDVNEIWVPAAKAIVTVPSGQMVFDDYLRVDDYYGPDEGMFTYLSLTPPVPNNPLPIAPVGIWHDLHVMANKMARKIMDQADRQKDVLGFKRAAMDDAQELIDAGDGEAIALDDPSAVQTFSWGGQQKSNEAHLAQLSYWFSMMAGNTDQLGGLKTGAETATGQEILQQNGSVRIEDYRDLVYIGTTTINRKLAWYLHTDPLISMPLVKRVPIPAQTVMTAMGPIMTAPPQMVDQQMILSPDARQGDFLDFQFQIEAQSMSRLDASNKLNKALLFCAKVLPSAASASQICAQMGVPFSFSKFLIRMGKELGLEWMDEVFYDPEFQMQMAELVSRTPQIKSSKGIMTGAPVVPTARGLSAPHENEIAQNGQAPGTFNVPSPSQEFNANAQAGASQSGAIGRM